MLRAAEAFRPQVRLVRQFPPPTRSGADTVNAPYIGLKA